MGSTTRTIVGLLTARTRAIVLQHVCRRSTRQWIGAMMRCRHQETSRGKVWTLPAKLKAPMRDQSVSGNPRVNATSSSLSSMNIPTIYGGGPNLFAEISLRVGWTDGNLDRHEVRFANAIARPA